MSAIDLPRARRLAFGVVVSQAAVSVVAALCAHALAGRVAALSALAGGAIATAGSLAMAGLVFGGSAGGAQRALSRFYAGEAIKLAVVVVFIGLGWMYIDSANYTPVIPPNQGEFGKYGLSGIMAGAGTIFFAYIGFDAVSTAA